MALQHLLTFLNTGVSPYHATQYSRTLLTNQGCIELQESDSWNIEFGKSYCVFRDDASYIAFRTPMNKSGMTASIIGSHTDSPTLKIKPQPLKSDKYHTIAIEIYGSPIYTSWLDRNLKFAGIVYHTSEKGSVTKSTVISSHTFRIPQLAIHLNRSINSEGQKVNPQEELNPLIGLATTPKEFEEILKSECGITGSILSWDLGFYEDVPATMGGISDEFVFGGRQDNLVMVSAALDAFLASKPSESILQCIAAFNHEEVGSSTHSGADSQFLDTTLERVYLALGLSRTEFLASMAGSFALSADAAHGVHPLMPEKHDGKHRPLLNHGPVVKINANMRYTSNPHTIAHFKNICTIAQIPFQQFSSRNDIPCGSTIGNMLSKSLGVPTVDVGSPMLAMHSISETTGALDYDMMVALFKESLGYRAATN